MFFTFYISSFLALFATKHSSHLLSPHNLTSLHHVTGRWNRWCVIIIISMPFIIITTMLTGGGGGASSFSWTSHLSHPLHQWTFRFQVSFIIYDSVIVISNILWIIPSYYQRELLFTNIVFRFEINCHSPTRQFPEIWYSKHLKGRMDCLYMCGYCHTFLVGNGKTTVSRASLRPLDPKMMITWFTHHQH